MFRTLAVPLLGGCLLAVTASGQQRGLTVVEERQADALDKAAGVGERYALLIGISKYADPAINLSFAAADAESLQKVLLDPEVGAYEAENVRVLLNEQGTRKNIVSALGTWLANRVRPEDSVVVFYSGHGALGASNDAYWVTYDADVEDLASSALSNKEISTLFAALPARRKLTLIDSCFSEATASKFRALVPSDIFREFQGQGVVTITASTGQEKSVEVNGHGAFTYHLLDALQGKADQNSNGVVELDELWDYLNDRVRKTAADAGNRQTPVLLADRMEHGVPLTLNPGRAAGATLAELKKLYSAGLITVEEIGEAERLLTQREGDPESRKLYRDLAAGVLTPDYFRQLRRLQSAQAGGAPVVEGVTRKVDSDSEGQRLAEAAAFDVAKASDTESGWEQYLAKYPNSVHVEEARRRVNDLRATGERQKLEQATYILAESQNTEQGWESFVTLYPTSQLVVLARSRLEVLRKARLERETSLYTKAVASNAADDWDRLLKEFPTGRFVEEAVKKKAEADRRLEEDTTLKTARSTDTLDSWKAYLDNYPEGSGAFDAKTRLGQLTWLTAADLVAVPAGSFMMGSSKGDDDARPEHRVEVEAFRIGRSEVTNGLYLKFTEETKRPRPKDPGFAKNYMAANPELPVVNVTYLDAIAFCKWLGEKTGKTVRLPTEAEWEYAALGGHDGYAYPWGGADPRTRARFNDNAKSGVQTVGRDAFPPNGFGLYNLSGNVAEWVADYYADNTYMGGTKKNPVGPPTGTQRVIRGGGFDSNATGIRVFQRDRADPNTRESWLGFRVVAK